MFWQWASYLLKGEATREWSRGCAMNILHRLWSMLCCLEPLLFVGMDICTTLQHPAPLHSCYILSNMLHRRTSLHVWVSKENILSSDFLCLVFLGKRYLPIFDSSSEFEVFFSPKHSSSLHMSLIMWVTKRVFRLHNAWFVSRFVILFGSWTTVQAGLVPPKLWLMLYKICHPPPSCSRCLSSFQCWRDLHCCQIMAWTL